MLFHRELIYRIYNKKKINKTKVTNQTKNWVTVMGRQFINDIVGCVRKMTGCEIC